MTSRSDSASLDDEPHFFQVVDNVTASNSTICTSQPDKQSFFKPNVSIDFNRFSIKQSVRSPFNASPSVDLHSCLFNSLLNDKVYQVHNQQHISIAQFHQRALAIIHAGVIDFQGHDATTKELWQGLMHALANTIKLFIRYCKELPGFSQISSRDLGRMVKLRLYDYCALKNFVLYINGEHFLFLPNGIQLSRSLMLKTLGSFVTAALFDFSNELNGMDMTRKELALTIPYILTRPGLFSFF